MPGISYDKNGNITRLERNGMRASNTGLRWGTPTGFGSIDRLNYDYIQSGNRLERVRDDEGGVSIGNPVDFRDNQSGGGATVLGAELPFTQAKL